MDRARRQKVSALAAGVALAILGTSGCSTDDSGTIEIVSQGDVRALVDRSIDGGMDAQITGTLAVNDSGCLGIATDAGTVTLVVWPKGTTLADDALVTPDGVRIEVGENVNGGGGERATLPRATDGDPATCEADGPGAFIMWTAESGGGG